MTQVKVLEPLIMLRTISRSALVLIARERENYINQNNLKTRFQYDVKCDQREPKDLRTHKIFHIINAHSVTTGFRKT